MNDPYLFDDLADDCDPSIAPPAVQVYTTPIEQAMELVDSYFRASMTVEEYDTVQKKVKGILTEAFDEKNHNPACTGKRSLLLMRNTTE